MTFLEFLEKTCPGDDAHSGLGDQRPLLERCGMCREIYEEHRKELAAEQCGLQAKTSKTLKECQDEVNAWVGQRTPAYWNPHQIYTRLGSEVGELGKEINHEFGPLRKKPEEKESSIVEESGDVLFTVICLLNSQKLSLDEAFRKAMGKCYGRDKDRFERVERQPPAAPCETPYDTSSERGPHRPTSTG